MLKTMTKTPPLARDDEASAQPSGSQRIKASGYAAKDAVSALTPFEFSRRVVGPTDVQIDILFCGICRFVGCGD